VAFVRLQALQHDMLVEAERLSCVLVRGRELLDQAQLVSDDVTTTIELVDSVDRRWASLRQSASDVSTRLKQVLPVSDSFHHGLTSLAAWIDLAEDRCSQPSGAVQSAVDVTQQLNNAQSLAADIERQRHNVDDVTSTGCQLLELADTDRSGVEQQMSSIEDRFMALSLRTYLFEQQVNLQRYSEYIFCINCKF